MTKTYQRYPLDPRVCSGGSLRKKRVGRRKRPLATKVPIHLVFKADRKCISGGFRVPRRFALTQKIIRQYQIKFSIKVEQISIQNDHIHLLIHTTRRSLYQNFFRVVAGQIAQRFEKQGLLTKPSLVTGTPNLHRNSRVTGTSNGATNRTAAEELRKQAQTISADSRWQPSLAGDKTTASATGCSLEMKKRRLWLHRPFTRVVIGGWRSVQIIRNYIQLNEKEALGTIPYKKNRLRGLSSGDWELLWQ